MFSKLFRFFLVLIVSIQLTLAQENAERKIASGLIECYADPYLAIKDNLLPHTIETLIELIRKIENSPGLNQGITQLTISLLHRFRQDGIVRNKGVSASNIILPFTASEFQLGKHQLLLRKLLPGNAINFPNTTLTPIERCSLHSMLSSSIDPRRRGDEGQRCNQLANYRAVRIPRSLKAAEVPQKKNLLNDVEFVEKSKGKSKVETFGKIQMNPTADYGDDYDEDDHIDQSKVDQIDFSINNAERSECPVENGVVQTIWGTISPGQVLNGIATGLQVQRVSLNMLMSNSRRRSGSQQNSVYVDNRWVSTLAGDLSEILLRQVAKDPERAKTGNVNIGASGAWNSSVLPKWYFLSERENYEMTDAEIRGGIDGLVIALSIKDWQSKASNLKLSQVLEMYYSQKGVFDSGIKACDRKKFFDQLIKPDELKTQTAAFSKMLQSIADVTIKEEAFGQLADIATNALLKYIPQSLNDRSCESTATNPNVIESEISTDLVVFVDTTWPYKDIRDLILYIISKINLNEKESSVTILDAMDGKVITPTSWDMSSVQSTWNESEHLGRRAGLQLPNVLLKLENITKEFMNYEKGNSSMGGRSLVSLIVPYTAIVSEADSNYAWERIQRLREDVPDVRIIFFAQGYVNRFERFVVDKQKDLIKAEISNEQFKIAQPVVSRLKEISRRIINHRCGSEWTNDNTGTSSMKQCVTPGSLKYYRIMPNYFFNENGNRKLRIQSQGGTSSVVVCVSRSIENPRSSNSTTNQSDDSNCEQMITKPFELDMTNPCSGTYEIQNCRPYYLSLEAKEDTGSGGALSDPECKGASDIPLMITTEHLTCHSGVERLFKSSLLIIASYVLALWFQF